MRQRSQGRRRGRLKGQRARFVARAPVFDVLGFPLLDASGKSQRLIDAIEHLFIVLVAAVPGRAPLSVAVAKPVGRQPRASASPATTSSHVPTLPSPTPCAATEELQWLAVRSAPASEP